MTLHRPPIGQCRRGGICGLNYVAGGADPPPFRKKWTEVPPGHLRPWYWMGRLATIPRIHIDTSPPRMQDVNTVPKPKKQGSHSSKRPAQVPIHPMHQQHPHALDPSKLTRWPSSSGRPRRVLIPQEFLNATLPRISTHTLKAIPSSRT